MPWLAGIARHKARDSLRRGRAEERARRRLGIPRESIADADLERVDELAGAGTALLRMVDQLPEPQRVAVRARVIDEREYTDIASELGASEDTVRQRVSRGLSWLRKRAKEDQR